MKRGLNTDRIHLLCTSIRGVALHPSSFLSTIHYSPSTSFRSVYTILNLCQLLYVILVQFISKAFAGHALRRRRMIAHLPLHASAKRALWMQPIMPQGVVNLQVESAAAARENCPARKYFPPPAARNRIADHVDKLATIWRISSDPTELVSVGPGGAGAPPARLHSRARPHHGGGPRMSSLRHQIWKQGRSTNSR